MQKENYLNNACMYQFEQFLFLFDSSPSLGSYFIDTYQSAERTKNNTVGIINQQ